MPLTKLYKAVKRRLTAFRRRFTVNSTDFDAEWYLTQYPDLRAAGVDPLTHYLTDGIREGREPGPNTAHIKHPLNRVENRPAELRKYVAQVLSPASDVSPEFVALTDHAVDASKLAVKAIAFYLPQYHPIPENDAWWGKGFTEWTNVAKAVPQFVGHYQPHLPGELGFYDLRLPEVQRRQVELAEHYGLYGFCFYHYWFGGKRLLERPVDHYLANPELRLPFCLCWANENWSRRWDGRETDVLIAQAHSPEDDIAFIADIERYLRDDRYIRIDGKPVLLVYQPTLLPSAAQTLDRWRQYWRDRGCGDLYLVATLTFDTKDPRELGFDAAVEFPPHHAIVDLVNESVRFASSQFAGNVYDYRELVKQFCSKSYGDCPVFRTVIPGWDNTARRPTRGRVFVNSEPAAYADWLRTIGRQTLKSRPSERILFINAWNEWAEGTHLEPDRKYGYAYLQATADVLTELGTSKQDVS